MIAPHLLASVAAGTLSLLAAFLAITSLAGDRDGRADALASFAPFAFGMAVAGALLAWGAFGPGLPATFLLVLDAVSAAVSLATIAPELVRLRPAFSQDSPALRILSGNLCWTNPVGERAVAAILARDADAVILQEAGRQLAGPLAGLKARYPHMATCPHSSLMIYAKSAIIAQECNCERADAPRGRLLTATIALAEGASVTLATTHFSHPYRGAAQALERRSLAAEIGALEVGRLILAGDFNTTPWSHGMRHQDEMLSPLRRRTIAWVTWPARLTRLGLSWPLPFLPIDHIYAGPEWGLVRLRRVHIPGSDHFATEAAFVWAGTTERRPPAGGSQARGRHDSSHLVGAGSGSPAHPICRYATP
jgi:vancomycin resistance protein VanJ